MIPMKQAGATVVCTTLRAHRDNIPLRYEWLLRGLTYFAMSAVGCPFRQARHHMRLLLTSYNGTY